MGPSSYFRQPPLRRQRWHARPQLNQVRLGGKPASAWGQRSRPARRWGWWRLVRWCLYLLAGGAATLAALVLWYSRDLPDPNRLIDRTVAQTTKLYDRTGETVLYEAHGAEKRSVVQLSNIPLVMQHATLVAEDRDFYSHGGLSIRGTVRAVLSNLTGIGRGGGGSTLTQQLVKNAILTNERHISRKLKEWVLAWRIEQRFTKDQILQLYLNEIPYGGSIYGIQSAAQSYFSKDVGQLTLAEAATLAAITNAPTTLSPYTAAGLVRLNARKDYVLQGMLDEGYATADEVAAARAEKLAFTPRRDAIVAPHFSLWVYQQLVEKYGQRMVDEGGLKVITSLDTALQKDAEEAVASRAKDNAAKYQARNAALVSIDVPTGQVRAMVGSADFFDEQIDGQVNVATAPRQPGSSFKPIVYAAAFDEGYSPQTVLFDLETDFPTDQGRYHPHNYDLKEHGPVTMRQALAGSLNIPAVQTLYLAGVDHVLDLAQRLGYSTLGDRSRFGLSLVLGGGEVSLLEHATAYSALARNGSYIPYSAVLKVEASDGRVLEEWQQPDSQQALRPEVAATLADVMSDNAARSFIFGSSNYLTLADRPVAAKTGTTNDYHDAWTMGFTPQLATGVWVGNSDNASMKRGADGSVVAAPIWQRFMSAAHRNLPAASFSPAPATFNLSQKPMLNGQWDGGVTVALDRRTGLAATASTPPEFIEERSFRQVHSILHWVDRGNPLGAAPSHPEQDPAYSLWEAPVERWRQQRGIANVPVPTIEPGVPSPNSLQVASPFPGQEVSGDSVSVDASLAGGQSSSDWRISLDGQLPQRSGSGQVSVSLPASLPNGSHTVTVTAITGSGDAQSRTTQFNLSRSASPFAVAWSTPQSVGVGSGVAVSLSPNLPNVLQVDIYVLPPVGSARWIGVASPGSGGAWTYPWAGPQQPGQYVISTTVTTADGRHLDGGAWLVTAG